MADLNPNIILAGNIPDLNAARGQGLRNAAMQNDIAQQNALAGAYRQYGAGIASGDQNALNALAGIDPMAALQAQAAQLGMQRDRQSMAIQQQQADRLTAEEARAAELHRINLPVAEREAEIAKIQQGTQLLGGLYASGDREGYARAAQSLGLDPATHGFDAYPAQAARYGEVARILSGKPAGETFRPATPDEAAQYGAAAGQIDTTTGRFHPINPPSGMSVQTNPDGTMTLVQGPGAGKSGMPSPADPAAMLSSIDGILNDPALEKSTGVFSWLQAVPGTPQRRFGARARQLEGQAFLQAFNSLRGAGAITEIEGQKATQAIGRLDTAQSASDYRQALTELRDIIVIAQSRMQAGARPPAAAPQGQPAQSAAPSASLPPSQPQTQARPRNMGQSPVQISDDAGYDALPSGAEFIGPDGQLRRKR